MAELLATTEQDANDSVTRANKPVVPQYIRKRSAVFLQNACLQHRFIRSKDISSIVERPERLRAVTIGLAAAIARLEELDEVARMKEASQTAPRLDLISAMDKLKLDSQVAETAPHAVDIVQSTAKLDIMNHPATRFIHGDIDRDLYLEQLQMWSKESWNKISRGESEIPENLSQGDLYLCPESISAMEGALGTVCEAVDRIAASIKRDPAQPSEKPDKNDYVHSAFVAIRPPGHHCGEDTPAGFCFVNNIAVGAAHAHLQHGINRIVIFDIDLHHGNGTQSIVWQINEETYRQTLEAAWSSSSKRGPQIYYGSIHDILSYPCEDGKPDLVQAASVCIHNAHGQFVENVHLEEYSSEEQFWGELYQKKYTRVLRKAEEFLQCTGGPGDDVMIFISCGMDACEHEYQSMSRHNRKVPTSFYYRFTQEARKLSNEYAGGRLLSVLEGGYSDRALISGSMAHLSGLVDVEVPGVVDENWWNLSNLTMIEKATKKKRGGRPSASSANDEPWLEKTVAIFAPLDAAISASSCKPTPPPSTSMTLRNRTRGKSLTPAVPLPIPQSKAAVLENVQGEEAAVDSNTTASSPVQDGTDSLVQQLEKLNFSRNEDEKPAIKKLPRIILKVGKPPET